MKSMIRREFGQRLKQARKQIGLTQEELSEALDVDHMTVSKWERGIMLPREELFPVLCERLEVPTSYFAGDPSPPSLTVGALTRIVEEQERRLQELQAYVAAHPVQDPKQRNDRSTTPSGQNSAEPDGELIPRELAEKLAKLKGTDAQTRDALIQSVVGALWDLVGGPKDKRLDPEKKR